MTDWGLRRMQAVGGAPAVRRDSAVRVVLSAMPIALATLFFVLRPLSIDLPGAGLDKSWAAVLGEAAMLPARWGVDLTFTYGPASALVTRYFTADYLTLAVPAACAVAISYALCFACLTDAATRRHRLAAVLTVVVVLGQVLALLALAEDDQDPFYFAFAFVICLLDPLRSPQDRMGRFAMIAGAATLGTVSIAKTSFGILAIVLFVASDLGAAGRHRRWPLLTPVFLVAFLTTFAVYGQRLGDLPAYVRLQAESVAGYGEAMYLPFQSGELVAFLIGAAGLLVVTGLASAGPWISRWVTLCCVGVEMIIALKAGFIRADTHSQISWGLLGLTGIAVGTTLVLPRSIGAAAMIGAASLLVLWLAAPVYLLRDTDRPADVGGVAQIYADEIDSSQAEIMAWARFVRSPKDFAEQASASKAAAWSAIRAQYPLPKLVGTVDTIASEQSTVLANRLDYHPRPSFQDYATDTAGLIAANTAFYEGASAPDWVLMADDALDDRFPTSIEGALWPDLLARYEPRWRDADRLALHRRATPLADVLGPPQRLKVRLGEGFAVPAEPVFAHIVVRKTLFGRLAAAIFRPPGLTLRARLQNGNQQSYRFIPALGAGGFLLSPIVEDPSSFALLAFGESDELVDKAVTEAVIAGSPASRFFYEPDVMIDLQTVTPKQVVPSDEARPLADELNLRRPWRQLVRRISQTANLSGDHLSAPAPTALTIPVSGARRLHLGFGIEDGAWTTGQVQTICFAVRTLAGGSALWQRCLDPRGTATDRGSQTADVDLPDGLTTATIATTCAESCDWGWSYWNDIRPEP